MKRLLILAGMCLSVETIHAQEIQNLVFEGAGVRGIAYVGAIQELEDRNRLTDVQRVAGTSAGAIAALTLSLGYSAIEMEEIISDLPVQQFNDGQWIFIGGFYRLTHTYGWYRGEAMTQWLHELIEQKTGNGNITFSELHSCGYRDLYVTGTSINQQRVIVFSHQTYPNMKVKDAVRISMNVPLYFQAVWIDKEGKILDPKKAKGEFDIAVDGGIAANFPIALFDSMAGDGLLPQRRVNTCTLGFRIDTDEQIAFDSRQQGLAPYPVGGLRGFVNAFYVFSIENLNRPRLSEQDWMRTVSISSGDIAPRVRKMSDEEKAFLIESGRKSVEQFLDRDEL